MEKIYKDLRKVQRMLKRKKTEKRELKIREIMKNYDVIEINPFYVEITSDKFREMIGNEFEILEGNYVAFAQVCGVNFCAKFVAEDGCKKATCNGDCDVCVCDDSCMEEVTPSDDH